MDVLERLRAQGVRLTGSRCRLIAGIPRDTPFRAEDLWKALRARDPRLGRATVFRTLAVLQQVGVLERVQRPDGSWCYRLCMGAAHHHHLTCAACGRDEVVDGTPLADLEAALGRVAAAYGYEPARHDIRLLGRCPTCARAAAACGVQPPEPGEPPLFPGRP